MDFTMDDTRKQVVKPLFRRHWATYLLVTHNSWPADEAMLAPSTWVLNLFFELNCP